MHGCTHSNAVKSHFKVYGYKNNAKESIRIDFIWKYFVLNM